MTVYNFTPPPRAPFRFNPTLDGAQYAAQVTWNVFSQRWYLTLTGSTGRILTIPLTGSPDAMPIAALSWAGVRREALLTAAAPHGQAVGTVVVRTVSGTLPAAYAGAFPMRAVSPLQLAYPLDIDPVGGASTPGLVSEDVNLVEGYFTTSTLVFRQSSRQFEVNP